LRNGDPVVIDVGARTLDVDDPTFSARPTQSSPSRETGVLGKYAALVGSAAHGATTTPENLTSERTR